jgi:hypothetical protein
MSVAPHVFRMPSHGRAAHDLVSVGAADDLYATDAVSWPVSGDVTAVSYGTIGRRRHGAVRLWSAPGVTRRRPATV